MKLMKWGPASVAIVSIAVIAFGLSYTLYKELIVAPWADQASNGRIHSHLKNVTRIGGTVEDIRAVVHRAVFLDEAPGSADGQADWIGTIRADLQLVPGPRHVVALPVEGADARVWALPGAFWAAYAGVPVTFVGRDGLSAEARETISMHKVPVYLLAPDELVSRSVEEEIRKISPVKRITAGNPSEYAVKLATYRDETTGFGWGRSHDQRTGYFEYVLATPSESRQALSALPLARGNSAAFLFTSDDGSVPAPTDRYLWAQRADWFSTPAEGPFRHLWIIGNRTSYAAQARLDLAVEKSPYPSKGAIALGPMEALILPCVAFGIAGAIFVFVHGRRFLPQVMLSTRLAWTMTAMLLPIVGVVLYFGAYRRPRLNPGGHMPYWDRPPAVQSAAATAMGFGFGAPLMIAIGYLFAYLGFPLWFNSGADSWAFLLGAGMPLMMAGMYFGTVLLVWPLVQAPMRAMMSGHSTSKVMWVSLGVVLISMTAVSIGMMTTAWWMMMFKLPMMPKEDDFLWFGAMWIASAIGFLIAWPLNWPMVRGHLKTGAM